MSLFSEDRIVLKKLKIAMGSDSDLKKEALESLFQERKTEYQLDCFAIETDISQPFNDYGFEMAKQRMDWLKEEAKDYDILIVIENFIQINEAPIDYVLVGIYDVHQDIEYMTCKICAPIPLNEIPLFRELLTDENVLINSENDDAMGSKITFGQLVNQKYPEIPANNWMKYLSDLPREQVIQSALSEVLEYYITDLCLLVQIENSFKYIENFPEPGVNFKSWDDLFLDNKLVGDMIEYLADKYLPTESTFKQLPSIDYVIGVESRGFLLSSRISDYLKVAEVFLRKKGKIAGPKISQSYQKEYGEDTLELRSDLPPGNVIICDDVLATGGSLRAAVDLVRLAGHRVVECIVIQDVPALREQANQVLNNVPVRVLIKDTPFLPIIHE